MNLGFIYEDLNDEVKIPSNLIEDTLEMALRERKEKSIEKSIIKKKINALILIKKCLPAAGIFVLILAIVFSVILVKNRSVYTDISTDETEISYTVEETETAVLEQTEDESMTGDVVIYSYEDGELRESVESVTLDIDSVLAKWCEINNVGIMHLNGFDIESGNEGCFTCTMILDGEANEQIKNDENLKDSLGLTFITYLNADGLNIVIGDTML